MVWAKSASARPMTLMGKRHGNSRMVSRSVDPEEPEFVSSVLIIMLPVALRLSVKGHDGQYFFGGRAQHEFIGALHFLFGNGACFKVNTAFCCQLFEQAVADAFEDEVVARGCQEHAITHYPDVA